MAEVELTGAYTLTIESMENTGSGVHWRNSLDIWSPSAVPEPDDAIVLAAIAMLTDMQREDSGPVNMTLRSWTRGDVIFVNQGHVWEVPITDQIGDIKTKLGYSTTDRAAAGELCLLVRKDQLTVGGRPGKLYLRNVYRNSSLENFAGGPAVLVPGKEETNASLTDIMNTDAAGFINTTTPPYFCTVHWSKKEAGTPFKTPIRQFVALGPVNHDIGKSERIR